LKIISAAAIAILLATGVSANATTNLVQNGDFSINGGNGQFNHTTSATDWYVPNGGYAFIFANGTADTSGANGQYGNLQLWGTGNGGLDAIGAPPSGAGQFVALDGAYQVEPLEQNISGLTVGGTYKVTFDYGFAQQKNFDGATIQDLKISLGGQSFTTPQVSLPSHAFTGWSTDTLTFTATQTTETLSFLAYGNKPVPPFALVAGVSLTAAVPELSTWAMMLAGFAGLGVAAHLRRRRSALAA
jgi:hypothetical protein